MSSAVQVTVIEEPDAPQERRRSLDSAQADFTEKEIDWDKTQSTPLKPCGGKKPNLVAPKDKHNTNEGQHGFMTFQVEGDPVPEIEWFKGFKDLSVEARYKSWTCGEDNTITLGCNTTRADDEGDYRVVLKNCNGTFEYEYKFFVTVEGGMDFRAALMKKKIKQKKVIVKKIEWLESPTDHEVQQGKCEGVTLVARLSEAGKKGKWYIRNAATFKDIRSSDFGLELFKGEHYDWTFTAAEKGGEPDTYTLNIINPTLVEGGTYSIVVRDLDMKTSCYVDVKAADPEFFFKKFLKAQENGLTARPLKLTAHLNVPLGPGPDGQPSWKIKWLKNGTPMQFNDQTKDARIQRVDKGEKTSLVFKVCELDDSGTYSAEIAEFVKNGEKDQTDCWLQVDEYPHTFTSKLKGQNVVEHDRCEFEIDCEAEDANVSWFKDGKKINPDEGRVEIVVEGKKRKLIFKDTLLSDAGEITCKTNKQSESCILKVAHANVFIKGLDSYTDAVEREETTFNVEVKDPNAPVDFYINGKKVSKSDTRCEYVNVGEGKHQLILHNIKMEDMGTIEARTPSNRGDEMLTSSTEFDVAMGEHAPEVGDCGPVTGIANKECNWKLPYKCEGVQQSPLEVTVMFRGKELKIGLDVNVIIHQGNIELSVINPKREKSGIYTVTMKNAQGESSRDINVNMGHTAASNGKMLCGVIIVIIGIIVIAVIAQYYKGGCNGGAHGIACCGEGFTTGDNVGSEEMFIQADKYQSSCSETCKSLYPLATGVTESLKQYYPSGSGKNRNKCWCEFGDPIYNATNVNYQTCVFRNTLKDL